MTANKVNFKDKQMREMGHEFIEGRKMMLISQHNEISLPKEDTSVHL